MKVWIILIVKDAVFWGMTPYILVIVCQLFGGSYCLHLEARIAFEGLFLFVSYLTTLDLIGINLAQRAEKDIVTAVMNSRIL